MNANAIYSKSGKGVQEAAGKTSHLSRPDRAVLSAIDGRATLAEVAQKVGKTYDAAYEKLIVELDKGGFIREVSAGTPGSAAKPGAAAKPAAAGAKPGASMDPGSDLDFTAALQIPRGKAAPPKATPPPAKQTATIPPPPPPPSTAQKVQAEKSAKEQQDAFAKAREEAEQKAQAERDRVKNEAEAKFRAETESKLRAEAEAKAKEAKAEADRKFAEELEAKAKAAREAAAKVAAKAKAKAEAEAKKAREEVERIRKEAEEKAERIRKEAEEQAERVRKEAEEKARREQEERKAREEAERKAKEEVRRLEEERAARKKREREEEEREARRKAREQEEAAESAREAARAAQAVERAKAEANKAPEPARAPEPAAKAPEPAKPAGGGGFSDSLLADLDSFTNRDEEERKEKEEAERKAKEAAAARAREEAEQRAKEEAERREAEEKARRKQEGKDRKAREEAELREQEEKEKARLKEEEEKRKKEAEEREKKSKQEETLVARSERGAAFDAQQRAKRERDLAAAGPKTRSQSGARLERKGGWGKPIAITLFLLAIVGVGVAHVMPIDVSDYQRAATDAFGREVKIGSANLSLVTGLQLKFSNVRIGDAAPIPEVRAFPELDALLGPRKAFSRIEIDGMKVEQQALGEALFAKVKADNFSVGRVTVRKLELAGPLTLPKGLELDVIYDREGAVSSAVLRGPEALLAKLTPKDSSLEIDMSASSFTIPFAPEISLSRFGLKGVATPQGLSISEWDGQILNGTVSGNANLRWGDLWILEGVLTARNITAAVFAPALLSEGRGEGSGKFSMRGADPGKLAESARLEGSFTVTRGVLGSIDLSRAIQTGGKQATGRTAFNEMNGNALYDRGAVALRNVTISAGQLNAGASADITPNGALSGRIVADVRIAQQQLKATLNLTGTLKDPQVKN